MSDFSMKKIKFIDFWGGFKPNDNYFIQMFDKYHPNEYVLVEENPDVLIYSVFGREHLHPMYTHCKKIYFTGENTGLDKTANMNITFENTTEYNNTRLPLWILYGYDKDMTLTEKQTNPDTDFACFVYSNNITFRNDLCKSLDSYKHVTCGGRCLNNIGGKIKNKIEFQKRFKFCIACENSKRPGYTTEKILDAYKSNCIPIYCGSSTVTDDFNPATFINTNDFNSVQELYDYVVKVDTDESLYKTFLNKHIFSEKWLERFRDPEQTFFKELLHSILYK